jgi:hypothetical protein
VRIWFVLALFLTSLSLAAPSSFADAGSDSKSVRPSHVGMIPPYVEAFSSGSSLGKSLTPVDEMSTWRASVSGEPGLATWDDDNVSSGSKGKYLPVLYSLPIPGTGEIAMGYPKRGVALIALEVAAWVGYVHYHDKGLDGRAEFEAFADAHWAKSRWIMNHPANEGLPPDMRTFESLDSIGQFHWSGWPGYHSYAAKDDVKLNYYENIGKYDWFISGWEDWDPVSKPMNTDLRDEYRALRQQSNSDLDKADRFIYLSIATRVFSVVETVILARRSAKSDGSKTSEMRSYSFKTRSTGLASGEVAFEYRF